MRTRLWVGLVLSGVLLAGLASGWPVVAQAADETTTTADPLAGMVGIGDDYYFSGAVITPADGSAVRSLSAYQAAVFAQSWLPTAFFGGPDIVRDPPPDLPVTRVDISGQWGVPGDLGVTTVYYATGPGQVYVGWPQNQPRAAAPGEPPPPPGNWFLAPARVTDALEGKADLVETAGTQAADDYLTATTEAGPQGADTESGEGADGAVRVAAAVAASGVLIALVWRRRRSH